MVPSPEQIVMRLKYIRTDVHVSSLHLRKLQDQKHHPGVLVMKCFNKAIWFHRFIPISVQWSDDTNTVTFILTNLTDKPSSRIIV